MARIKATIKVTTERLCSKKLSEQVIKYPLNSMTVEMSDERLAQYILSRLQSASKDGNGYVQMAFPLSVEILSRG